MAVRDFLSLLQGLRGGSGGGGGGITRGGAGGQWTQPTSVVIPQKPPGAMSPVTQDLQGGPLGLMQLHTPPSAAARPTMGRSPWEDMSVEPKPSVAVEVTEAAASRPVQAPVSDAGFYSKAVDVAMNKVSNRASPSEVISVLRNNGVKEAEIEALGLNDFLSGKQSVDKSELLVHMTENTPRIKRTIFEAPTPELRKEIQDARTEEYRIDTEISSLGKEMRRRPDDNEISLFVDPIDSRPDRPEAEWPTNARERVANLRNAQGQVKNRIERLTETTPRYEGHNAGGPREGYREVLVKHENPLTPYSTTHFRGNKPEEIIGWTRVSTRNPQGMTQGGNPFGLLEEAQSDHFQKMARSEQIVPARVRASDLNSKNFSVQSYGVGASGRLQNPNGRGFFEVVVSPENLGMPLRSSYGSNSFMVPVSIAKSPEEAIELVKQRLANSYNNSIKSGRNLWEVGVNSQAQIQNPFSGVWGELLFKNALIDSVNRGEQGLLLTPSKYPIQRGGEAAANGLREYYEKIAPSIMSKVGKQAGAKRVDNVPLELASNSGFDRSNTIVEATSGLMFDADTIRKIKQGLPLFSVPAWLGLQQQQAAEQTE